MWEYACTQARMAHAGVHVHVRARVCACLCVLVSRGGLAFSVSSYKTTDPGSILGVAIFPGYRRSRLQAL